MDDGMRAAKNIADLVEQIAALEERKKTTNAEFTADLNALRETLGQAAKDIHAGQVSLLGAEITVNEAGEE